MSRYPKLLTELVGTFIFFTVIALSGNAGDLAPLAIGGILMCMVFMGGHISGAHYNPAISYAVFFLKKNDVTDLIAYCLEHVVGCSHGLNSLDLAGVHSS